MTLLDVTQIQILRKAVRKKRRELSSSQLRKSEILICAKVLNHPSIRLKTHIGIYLDAFGEVPTKMLIHELFKRKKLIYLPLICNMTKKLRWQPISFAQWRSQRFALHRLGMKQAMHHRGFSIQKLDTVLMPLVLFDIQGHRVGMGGGFYDRTLAQHPHFPKRLGVAHSFQKSPFILPRQPWDQALDSVCTPDKIWRFNR